MRERSAKRMQGRRLLEKFDAPMFPRGGRRGLPLLREAMVSAAFHIASDEAGVRLDQFLAARVPALSRSRIQELIKSGHVQLNGRATKASARLRRGDALDLNEPPPTPATTQAEDIALDVLFEDDDLIVLNKPPGMVVHPAAGNWQGTLVNALLHHCRSLSGIGGEQRPGIVHRLDKDTSGCLVVAKNDATHQALTRQFAGREVTKIYLALAVGKFRSATGIIEGAIGRHPVQRKKMTVLTNGRGRVATTSYRVLRELAAGTLVECTLHSGRTHQIRVHLKHLGHPLLGDEVYGKRAGFPRQMLHAWKLGFVHPRSGERVTFLSPIPPDFVEAGIPSELP
jgi:23S rRNA pseudouridine1911/1915/1917 synthase